jgi:multidrug efflux pump subunit AcrA (membrane-fusion protein)
MTRRRGRRSARPWYLYLFGVVAIVIIALGVSEVGTPTSSARTSKEVVTAEDGVVQSTVSGSGNVEPGVDDAVNFATSGTLQTINVTVGEHVKKGQLIATLDPSSAQLTLQEAEDSLTSAEDNLTSAEDGDSTSSGSGSSNSSGSSGSDAQATAASAGHDGGTGTTTTEYPTTTTGTTTGTTTTTTGTTTTGTTTTPTRTTPTRTTPTRTTPTRTTPTRTTTGTKKTSTGTKKTSTGATKTTGGATSTKSDDSAATKTTTTTKSTPSPSEIAQEQSSVDSAEANVTSAEKALADTKLYAPVTGTLASLSSDEIGQTVSSGSSAAAASDSAAATSAATGANSSSSSSSSSGFATIIDNKTMTMTVSLSESDISSVKVGQIATVSLSALTGVELGGKVTSISPLGSSTNGVVSYDVGLTIYQYNPKVLPGMSATATIVTGQAQGVTLPTEAVTGDTVDLDTKGKITTQSVTVGLKGTSREVIESGLKTGQEVQITITLPALGTSTTSTASSSATSGFGGAGGFGGGTGGLGGGGAARAFFGGGGA